MKRLLMFSMMAIAISAYSQKKLVPATEQNPVQDNSRLDASYNFATKSDTTKCSFLYVAADGFIVSDRGYVIRVFLKSEKLNNSVNLTQIVVTEKGIVVDPKNIVNILESKW